jgi:hypothetical protein
MATQQVEKAFSKLTKAEKRVAIAEDVLLRLKKRKFDPRHMTFVSREDAGQMVGGRSKDVELQEAFRALKEPCSVCACFLSAVDKFDELKIGELLGAGYSQSDTVENYGFEIESHDVLNYLSRWFSLEQLKLVEMAFEQGEGWFDLDLEDEDDSSFARFQKAANFTKGLRSPKQKMTAIMQNIVDNKGTFKP